MARYTAPGRAHRRGIVMLELGADEATFVAQRTGKKRSGMRWLGG